MKASPMTPTSKKTGEKRDPSEVSVRRQRSMESPLTPGRLSTFNFGGGNPRSRKKGIPSKWDDADKWLVGDSCHESPALPKKSSESLKTFVISGVLHKKGDVLEERVRADGDKAFHGAPSEVKLQDKFTKNVDSPCPDFLFTDPPEEGFPLKDLHCKPMRYATTEVFSNVQHRDIGTSVTPLGSVVTSRCRTTIKSSSPPRHNTPLDVSGPLVASNAALDIAELKDCHFAKLRLSAQCDSIFSDWSSKEEEKGQVSKSLRKSCAETRVSLGEEEEKANICIRYQREKAKIQAWVNLQSAKAEAESRRLEVKIQKMRSKLEEKHMRRMAIVERRAEEWRSSAQLHHSQQILSTSERAHKMQNMHTSHVSISCGCFPCNNHL